MGDNFITIHELYSRFLDCESVSIDSREVKAGSMFFALKGDNLDGNRFASHALSNGAKFAIVDDPGVIADSGYLLVEDTLSALQSLAQLHRKNISPLVIGITGSNGKTTTKELINAVVSEKYKTTATQGNLNNHIGVPMTILSAAEDAEVMIVEMGANHSGEIAMLSEIAKPSYGIITNIGKAHLEGFLSLDGVKAAKSELYKYLAGNAGSVILWNCDDPVIEELLPEGALRLVSYGINKKADVRGKLLALDHNFMSIKWLAGNDEEYIVKTNLVGNYNFPNVMAAIATGTELAVEPERIVSAITSYNPSNNRSQLMVTDRNRLIADCYNANPASIELAISNFMNMELPGQKLMILGDMFELGKYADEEHIRILQVLSGLECETILVGSCFHKHASQFGYLSFPDIAAMTEWIKQNPFYGRQILLKASRGVQLERILPYL